MYSLTPGFMPITVQTKRANSRIDQQTVNGVIEILQTPDQQTLVAETHSNSKNQDSQIQAYAKLAGCDWTYYIQRLSITIGRSQEVNNKDNVDIDLYPIMAVSRHHAIINYNLHTRCWELKVVGKNGVRIDGYRNITNIVKLRSGCVIEIMGLEMMFIEANSVIAVSPKFTNLLESFNKTQYLLENSSAPPYSVTTMIAQAMLANHDFSSFNEIYTWIIREYPYYKHTRTTISLQKSITHTLNVNKAFEPVYANNNPTNSPPIKWRINEKFKHELLSYMSLEYQFTKFPTIANIQDVSLRVSLHKRT
ncbi:Fork-head transcriptional regulator 2 [Spathaspora sp. JA1]|nr:Fork-head transcriptional regulator 2 [Spathaspora sp. JA1]